MGQEYFEAANKITQLVDEYDDYDEICQALKACSIRIVKMATIKNRIIKTASASNGISKKV